MDLLPGPFYLILLGVIEECRSCNVVPSNVVGHESRQASWDSRDLLMDVHEEHPAALLADCYWAGTIKVHCAIAPPVDVTCQPSSVDSGWQHAGPEQSGHPPWTCCQQNQSPHYPQHCWQIHEVACSIQTSDGEQTCCSCSKWIQLPGCHLRGHHCPK